MHFTPRAALYDGRLLVYYPRNMHAVIVRAGKIALEEVPAPSPQPGEVLVKIKLAGICSTDLEILKGYGDFEGILGHEFVGVVESAGSALHGRRVVGEINCVCGKCDMCTSGLSNHCRRRTVVGIAGRPGVFAEYIALPERNCHLVPDSVTDEQAVFVEPLAAACQIIRQVKIEPRMHVAVLGTGRLGLLATMVLSQTGCRLIAVGRNPKTLGLLDRRRIRVSTVAEFSQWSECDVVIECTGSPEGLPLALQMVRPRGTIVLKSTCHAPAHADLTPLVVNEIALLGNRCGPFSEALSALAQQRIDVAGLVTRRMPLAQAADAFVTAASPDTIKVILTVAS